MHCRGSSAWSSINILCDESMPIAFQSSKYFPAAVYRFLLSIGHHHNYFEIRGVNLGQGTLHIVRDSERFEITEFEKAHSKLL